MEIPSDSTMLRNREPPADKKSAKGAKSARKDARGPHQDKASRARARAGKDGMPFTDDPLWYKDAVIYQIHVKSYFDANDDGIGDFAGLIRKLDYIAGLGVNTIWLQPFYPRRGAMTATIFPNIKTSIRTTAT